MNDSMTAKSVLITGASTGIGEACARFLDEREFRVFAGVRSQAAADRLRGGASETLTPVMLDVVDPDSIDHALAVVGDAVGASGLSGLVNNAGIGVVGGPLEFTSPEALRRQFEVNVFGQVCVTQRFLSLLRVGIGRIVNMGSMAGLWAAPFLGPYSMSKYAVEAYSDSLRRELHPWDVGVSCVEPGAIATPIWEKALDSAAEYRATAPPEAVELYGPVMDAVVRRTEEVSRRTIPATTVAQAVHHALTARRPKTRYLVGSDAKAQALLSRVLSDRMSDALLRLFMKLDEKRRP